MLIPHRAVAKYSLAAANSAQGTGDTKYRTFSNTDTWLRSSLVSSHVPRYRMTSSDHEVPEIAVILISVSHS